MTKIVLPKVLQNFKLRLLAQGTEPKSFPRNIQYRTRPKGPPFQFFGIARLFSKKIVPKGSRFQVFSSFATEWMLKNPKGSPFQFFWHFDTFSKKKFGSCRSEYFDTLTLFLNLRYDADLGRSRLVTLWVGKEQESPKIYLLYDSQKLSSVRKILNSLMAKLATNGFSFISG